MTLQAVRFDKGYYIIIAPIEDRKVYIDMFALGIIATYNRLLNILGNVE